MIRQLLPIDTRQRAILSVCAASLLFALCSAMIKALGPEIPSVVVAFFRSAIGAAIILGLILRSGRWSQAWTKRPWGHALRTFFGFTSMVATYYGYSHLPLALATAIGFAMPIVLCLLSAPLLGEKVGKVQMIAAMVGLGGVLVMLRPWQIGMGSADALPLVPVLVVIFAMLGWALAMISIRRLGALGESNTSIVLWFALGSTVLSATFMLPVWVTPTTSQLVTLLAIGTLSGAAQILMTHGYRSAEGALVAPFEYGAIVYATLLGLIFWGEVPDAMNLLGMAILIGAGWTIWRQART